MMPTKNYRLSHLMPVCVLALGLSSTSPPALALDTDLPDLGNTAGNLMTPKRERELGKAFMRSVRRTQNVLDDPVLTDYVQQLGQRLVDAGKLQGTAYTFFLIEDPQINAFAGPGGYIGIYSGLVLTTETESELASVVAHEIAHVSQQHLLRTWESTSNMSVPNAALLLAAVALGATVGGDAAMAAAVGGQAALLQRQINFTRANEKEADRVGIEILSESDFEPRAMPSFFSRLNKSTRVYASAVPELLRTHPVTTSRTADALGRAEQYPYRQSTDDLDYQLARMNLLQRRIDQPEDAVGDLTRMLEDGRFRNESALRYGLALALIRANRYSEAGQALDQLLETRPQTIEFVVARAEVDRHQDRPSAALDRLATALKTKPGSLALTVAYAETALLADNPAAAEKQLQRFLQSGNAQPRVYQLLARSASKQQKHALGHQYLSNYHYLLGDLEQAIRQMEIAVKTPGLNFYDASRFESLLAELKAEQADLDSR